MRGRAAISKTLRGDAPIGLSWRGIDPPAGQAENENVRILAAIAVALLLAAPAVAAPVPLPDAPACPLFPETNVWNTPVGKLPLRLNSRKIVRAIGARLPVHADFGSGLWEGAPIGIPITVVGKKQKKTRVSFEYADASLRSVERAI